MQQIVRNQNDVRRHAEIAALLSVYAHKKSVMVASSAFFPDEGVSRIPASSRAERKLAFQSMMRLGADVAVLDGVLDEEIEDYPCDLGVDVILGCVS